MWLGVGEEREPGGGVGRKKERRICIRSRVSTVAAACGGERKMMDIAETRRKKRGIAIWKWGTREGKGIILCEGKKGS